MITSVLEEKVFGVHRSPNRIASAIDVSMSSAKHMQTYSAAETKSVWTAHEKILNAYPGYLLYINFRKDFVAIKVANCKHLASTKITVMEKEFFENKITKVITPQGLIYRIPKVA